MENTYLLKQKSDQALFTDVLWSRPETKTRAGKLLIIGGHKHSFATPTNTYNAALKAGIGACRILLPDSLKKIVIPYFSHLQGHSLSVEFGASEKSGGFGQAALAQMLEEAKWADGVLLAGDFGKNSETAILLEKFIEKYDGQLTLAGDSLDYFITNHDALTSRRQSVIVTDFTKLQKIVSPLLIKHDESLMTFVNKLHDFTENKNASLVTLHADQIIVAVGGQLSSTSVKTASLVELAAYVSVWWLQQPKKPFEALTTAAFCLVS